LLTAHLRFATEAYWVRVPTWAKPLGSIILLAGIAYLGVQGARLGKESYWLDQANAAEVYSEEQMTALKRAYDEAPENFDTTFKIAELIRMQSFEGAANAADQAAEAMLWYGRTTNANPHWVEAYVGYGMCLDYVGRHDEAFAYFEKADRLDPNGFFSAAHMGWHYVQVENYAAAKPWLERSWRLHWRDNATASTFLPIVNERLSSSLADRIGKPSESQIVPWDGPGNEGSPGGNPP
jgi:tetratricopeptide (TPR) repeat protein